VHLYGSVTAADIVEGLKGSVLRKLGIREKSVRLQAPADEAVAPAVETTTTPAEAAPAADGAAAPAPAPAPAAAAAAAAAVAHVVTSHAIKTVGSHAVQIEPRPGLWCTMTVVVESS
jgi:ribosomal protein L9